MASTDETASNVHEWLSPTHLSHLDAACQVCGDSPSKRHYGARCCNSCKCFFRRCVSRHLVYTCTNKCMITKESRISCRGCRYARCLAVGLNPEMIINGKGESEAELPENPGEETSPYGSNQPPSFLQPKGSSSLPLSPIASTRMPLIESNTAAQDIQTYYHQALVASSRRALEVGTSFALGSFSGLVGHQASVCYESLGRYFVSVEHLCESYSDTPVNCASPHIHYDLNTSVERAFLEPRSLIARTAVDWEARYAVNEKNLARKWCRAVAFYADWASHIPELQLLDFEDRVKLLAGRMTPSWCLSSASRSIRQGDGRVVICADGGYFPLDDKRSDAEEVGMAIFQPMVHVIITEIVLPALSIHVREEELALLKVLCFCVPLPHLKPASFEIIQSARAKYQAALVAEVMKHPDAGGMLGNIGRLVKMMSWLTTAERVAEQSSKRLSLMTLFNVAEMKGSLPHELHVRANQ